MATEPTADPARRFIGRALVRHASVVRFLVGAGAAAGLLAGARWDDAHTAEVVLEARPVVVETELSDPVQRPADERDVNVLVALAESDAVSSRAQAQLGRSLDYSARSGGAPLVVVSSTARSRFTVQADVVAVADALVAESAERRTRLLTDAGLSPEESLDVEAVRGDPQILDRTPEITTRSAPDPVLTGLIGALLGSAAALAVACVRERYRTTVATADNVEATSNTPVAVWLPSRDDSTPEATIDRTISALVGLRPEALVSGTASSILVLACGDMPSQEAAGDVGVALAVAAARRDCRAVAVDLDSANGHLTRRAGLDDLAGLTDVVEARRDLLEVAVAPQPDLPLRVVPRGTPAGAEPDAASLSPALRRRNTADLVSECGYGADVLVTSSGPPTEESELPDLIEGTHCVLLVATVDETSKDDLARCVRVLHQHGAPGLGLVVVGGPPPTGVWPTDGVTGTREGERTAIPRESEPMERGHRLRPARARRGRSGHAPGGVQAPGAEVPHRPL